MKLILQKNINEKNIAMDPREKFIERLKRNQGNFSASDRKIADYLIHSYPGGLLEPAAAIAEKLGVSAATVTRFFPKIEFKNIRHAQETFRNELDFLKNSPLDRYHQLAGDMGGDGDAFDRAWDLDIANLRNTYRRVTKESIEAFAGMVSDHGKTIYVAGERKTFALAFYLYVQLNSLHPNVVHISSDQSLVADKLMKAEKGDVLIVFDFRRYPTVNVRLAKAFKELGGYIIVVGDSPLSPCAKLAQVMFLVESKGLTIFDSYTAGFSLINALLAVVTQRVGNYVRERYETLESHYRLFGIFSSQELDSNISKLPQPDGKKDKSKP